MSVEPNRSSSEESAAPFRSVPFEAARPIDELRSAIAAEDPVYPWNPADPAAEPYYSDLEQKFALTDCFEPEEIEEQAEAFFEQLHQCWKDVDAEIEVSLSARFGNVPVSWLEIIARQAKNFLGSNFSRVQQLVGCVKPLFADWAEEDLTLLARPIAQTVRGDSRFKQASWDDLSSVDKVRLSMAIAHHALTHLQAEGR